MISGEEAIARFVSIAIWAAVVTALVAVGVPDLIAFAVGAIGAFWEPKERRG